jgi:hypothetical protein
MEKVSDLLKYVKQLDSAKKLEFYDRLGFNLTIAVRSIWSNPVTSDKEKIEAIKIVNELSHRVFNWMWKLRDGDQTFEDSNCFSVIEDYARQNREAAGEIAEAFKSSYLHSTRQLPKE